MAHQYSFEKLEIWKLAISFAKDIYSTTKDFPDSEKFGIISQLRRAASSVSANIAEGSARTSINDKKRFFQISYGSLMEVLNFLILSQQLEFINDTQLAELRAKIEELSNKINAFHKKL